MNVGVVSSEKQSPAGSVSDPDPFWIRIPYGLRDLNPYYEYVFGSLSKSAKKWRHDYIFLYLNLNLLNNFLMIQQS